MAYEQVEVWLQPFLTSAVNGMYGHLRDAISFILARKAPDIHWIRGKVGPSGGLDTLEKKKKISYVCRVSNQDSLVVQPIYYADYAIPAAFKNVGVSKLQRGKDFFRSILQRPAYPQPVLASLWNIMRHCFTQRPTETPVNSKMALHMANRKRLFSFSKFWTYAYPKSHTRVMCLPLTAPRQLRKSQVSWNPQKITWLSCSFLGNIQRKGFISLYTLSSRPSGHLGYEHAQVRTTSEMVTIRNNKDFICRGNKYASYVAGPHDHGCRGNATMLSLCTFELCLRQYKVTLAAMLPGTVGSSYCWVKQYCDGNQECVRHFQQYTYRRRSQGKGIRHLI
jgi:hypothetical protein